MQTMASVSCVCNMQMQKMGTDLKKLQVEFPPEKS